MKDYYSAIYDTVSDRLKQSVPELNVVGSVSSVPTSKFPCAAIEEINNTHTESDNGPDATYSILQYRITTLSNKIGGKIAEARRIAAEAETIMLSLNFRRTSRAIQDGLYNNSAYQIQDTYEARISSDGTLSLTR